MSLQDLPIYLVTIVGAWLLAHIVKYLIALTRGKALTFGAQVFRSGGMPSAHTTTVTALVTVIGLVEGVYSAVFGLGVMFLLIIIHDAMRVRRSSGEQGQALVQLIKEQKSKVPRPYLADGHSPLEVWVGAVFGLLIGLAVFVILR